MCDPGYEDPDGDGNCTECSVGTYKSGLGNEACDACAANKTTNATGKLDSSSCGRSQMFSFKICAAVVNNFSFKMETLLKSRKISQGLKVSSAWIG